MKETNTNETAFDSVFREGLADASTPVPPGVWEGMASSVGAASAAGAAPAVQAAFWLKVTIGAAVVAAAGLVAYLSSSDAKEEVKTETNKTEVFNDFSAAQKQNEVSETGMAQEAMTTNKPKVGISGQKNERKTEISGTESSADDHQSLPEFRSKQPVNNYWNIPSGREHESIAENRRETAEPYAGKPEETAAGDQKPEEAAPDVSSVREAVHDSSRIFIPNAVTCDGDGINDTYLISLVNEESVEIIIYDPKSNDILFRTKNKYQGWNCTLKNGAPAPAGSSYVVKVIYKFRGSNETHTEYSKLTIIR